MKNIYAFILLSSFIILNAISLAFAQSPNWINVGPIPFPAKTIGQVHGIARCSELKFHPSNPNKMYTATGTGGLWKTADKGVTWTNLGTDQIIKVNSASLAIDPSNDKIIYWGTGDDNYYSNGYGVYKTTNEGITWAASNTGMGNRLVTEILIDPQNTQNIIAATNSGIYKSTNAGASWTLRTASGLGFQDMVFKANNGTKTIYGCTKSGFYRSTDKGDTWTQITSGLTMDGGGARIAVSSADSNVVYVGITKAYGAIFRSTNGGTSFVSRRTETTKNLVDYGPNDTGGGQGNYNFDIVCDPTNANTVYLCSHIVWNTTDGGATWNQKQNSWAYDLHTDQHQLLFNPYVAGELWNVNDGGIWKNSTGGTGAWTPMSDGIAASEIYHGSGSNIYKQMMGIGTQDNGGFYFKDGVWYNNRGGDYGEEHQSDYASNTLYHPNTGNRDVIIGTTSGNIRLPFTADGNNKAFYAFTPANTNVGYVYNATTNTVYRSSNLVAATPTWTTLFTCPAAIKDMKADVKNADILYVIANDNKIYRLDNALTSGTYVTVNTPVTLSGNVEMRPMASANGLYLATSNKTFKSNDKGAAWTDISTGMPSGNTVRLVADVKSATDAVYYATSLGIYYYDNTRTSWLNYSQGLPIVCSINDMDVYNTGTGQGYVRVYFYGRGVWESPVKQTAGAPYVAITSPVNLSTYTTNANITITASASDVGGSITKVVFYNGATIIGTATTSPYTITWNNVSNGTYTITAIATDNSAQTTTSEAIVIGVSANQCTATGTIGRDQWDNTTGTAIVTSLLATTPTSTSTLMIFEGPADVGDDYQSRIRGYVCPPLTGTYTFWIASDDNSELWLSTNDQPANKVLISQVSDYTNVRGWDDNPEQKSAAITLQAGTKYYIEAVHKEGGGGDHLAVGWQLPGGSFERPIIGARLSPYTAVQDPNVVGTFYQDCNYGGYAKDLLKGDYTTAQLVANGIVNNDVSSIKVKSKFEVALYDLDNFKGDSLIINADNSCLVANAFNDKTSSIKIRKDSKLIGSFFQHCNYDPAGYSVDLYEGNYTNQQLVANGIANNDISSFTVKTGYEVALFDGDNFTGDSIVITSSSSCLVSSNFNDKVSSLKIRRLKIITNQDESAYTNSKVQFNMYPNPVENTANLRYELTRESDVEIVVYTADGKLIETIFNGYNASGEHLIKYDSSRLSNGLYVLKISSNQSHETFRFSKVVKPKKR